MGMFLAVGQGSDNPPRMIVMRSGGEGREGRARAAPRDRRQGRLLRLRRHQHQAIRPDGRDEDGQDRCVHGDRGHRHGRPPRAGHAAAGRRAAVENMPGSHSTRPGDVVKALNGKWVDITNTDAEGRLILGDAMTYAEQLGATHLVDVATLTGAVSRALRAPRHGRLRNAPGLVRRGHGRRRQGRASGTGRSRSSTTTCPTWRAGTAISRTPARPKARS